MKPSMFLPKLSALAICAALVGGDPVFIDPSFVPKQRQRNDAERIAAAQAKRERKAAKRRALNKKEAKP